MPRNRGIATHSEAAATPDVNTSFIGTTIVIGNGAAVHIKGAAIDPCTGIISIDAAATHGERSVACNYHTIASSACNSAPAHSDGAAGDTNIIPSDGTTCYANGSPSDVDTGVGIAFDDAVVFYKALATSDTYTIGAAT